MEAATLNPNISEALAAVGQYLSDTIPPVQAVEPVAALLQQPPQLMISEILEWISTQFQGNNGNVSYADYLFHAVTKLHYLTQLQLIHEQALAPYLDSVKQLLMERCPPEDRQLLQENFGRLGVFEIATATQIGLIYRQVKSGESESRIAEGAPSGQSREHRFSMLRDRLQSAVRQSADCPADGSHEDLIPHMIATAASDARTSEEFRKLQENLKSLGISENME